MTFIADFGKKKATKANAAQNRHVNCKSKDLVIL